ncbi:hypothetical protein [Streptomyces sp. NPDC048527]|uniref:hypothetical protein n=1 Tax=Streptomyces sp. NPDC048527 TaxID=3365568 RepID=UPI0037201AC2
MGHWDSRGKATGRVAGIGLLCTLTALLVGCSSTTHTATATATATKPGATAQPSTDQTGIQNIVATWVAAIINGNPAQVCSVMGQPATATSPPQHVTPKLCAGKGPQQVVDAWRPRFTPKHMTGRPTVRVSQVPVTGSTASVPARDIDVNGQSLHAILVSHGAIPSTTNDKIRITKINGSWCVTGFFGPQG